MDTLKSEFLKFVYNKWLLLTIVSTILLIPLLVIFLHKTPEKISNYYVLSQIAESYYLGQSGIMIIVILFAGEEFIKSTLRSSLIATPNRWKFIACKLFTLLLVLVFLWSVIALLSVGVVKIYYDLIMVKEILFLSAKVAISHISLIIICFSLVILTKSTIFSIGISLSFLLGLGHMLLQFYSVFLYFPILSVMNTFFIYDNSAYLPCRTGVIIQYLWSIILLIVAIYVFIKRGIR